MKTTIKEVNKMFETNSHIWDNKIAFSVKDVSEMLGLPISTLSHMCKKGDIKTFKVGRHYRIARVDLYNFIERQKDMSIVI